MLGTCFQGKWCHYAKGHVQQGEATDAFANLTLDCVSKGVLYYTNLPPDLRIRPATNASLAGRGQAHPDALRGRVLKDAHWRLST